MMTQDASSELLSLSIAATSVDGQHIELSFSGALTAKTLSTAWQAYLDAMPQPKNLVVEAQGLQTCDEAGIALLAAIEKEQLHHDRLISFRNLDSRFRHLLEKMLGKRESAGALQLDKHHSNLTLGLGHITVDIVTNLRENIIFIGETLVQACLGLRYPSRLRWKDLWRVAENVGPDALLIIALVGFLMGLISAFQAAIPMKQFGVQLYIANLVGISLVRELGPLMTAVILAGRTASSFSAELGTMKINREIDALSTMGLRPVAFLVTPRIIATTLITPLLNVFLIFFGLIGCYVVMISLGFTLDVYIRQLRQIIHFKDFIGGTIKAFVFGILIAGVGCLHGLKTNMGASAVGQSTTRAVVNCIILIIIVDGIFACLYYALGV